MIEQDAALATNRAGWNHVAKYFHGITALPEYGPLTPTEDTLRLLDEPANTCVLELGCGSGHSLRYLADRGARELWDLDWSATQIAFAEETRAGNVAPGHFLTTRLLGQVAPGIG